MMEEFLKTSRLLGQFAPQVAYGNHLGSFRRVGAGEGGGEIVRAHAPQTNEVGISAGGTKHP